MLLGILFLSTLLPYSHIGYPTAARCMTHICAQGPSFTLGVSILLVKTHHIKKVFEAKRPRINCSARGGGRRQRNWGRSETAQFVCVMALTSMQVGAIIVYLVTNFPVEIQIVDALNRPVIEPIPLAFVQCAYGFWTYVAMNTYNLILILVCFILSFKARHIPTNFCESRHIAAAMATTLIILILCLVGMFLSRGRMRAIYQTTLVTMVPFLQTLFLFIPKCSIIVCHPARNTVDEVRRMTLTHADWKIRCAIVSRNTLHQMAGGRDCGQKNECGGQENEAVEVDDVICEPPIPPRWRVNNYCNKLFPDYSICSEALVNKFYNIYCFAIFIVLRSQLLSLFSIVRLV